MFESHNSEKGKHAYVSKHSLTLQNQIILLIITDGKKWHYLAIKKLSALFRGITSNHNGDFCSVNCYTHLELKINSKDMKI